MIDDKTPRKLSTEELGEKRYMQRVSSKTRDIYSTPVRLLIVTTTCVFVAESLIMKLLSVLPNMTTWTTVFLDATLIVVCVLPVLYLSLFRPLRQSVIKLAESEEKFKGIYSQSPVGIEIYDIDGKLIDVNQVCLDMFGIKSIEEIKGFRLFEDPNLPDKEKDLLRKGEEVQFETEFDFDLVKEKSLYKTSKSGRMFIDSLITPFKNYDGSPRGYLVHVRDITERKRAEEALKVSEEKYRKLVECNPHGIQEIDLSGHITYGNPSYQKMIGFTEEEMLGKSILDLLDRDEARDNLRSYLPALIKDQPEPTTYMQKNRTKDGRIIDQNVDWNYVRDNDGCLIGFVSIITDVTEQKRAQNALKKSEEKYRLLAENMSDFVFVQDMNLNITYVSPSITKLFGYSVEEAYNLKINEIMTEDSYGRAMKYFQKYVGLGIEKGEIDIPTMEFEYLHKDGSTFWGELNVELLKDSQGRLIGSQGAIRDITERRRAEDRVRLLLDNLPCIAMILKKGTREIVASNKAAHSVGAVPGKTCYETCTNREESCAFCLAPEMWEAGETRDIEVEHDGVWYHGIWVPLTNDLYVHYIFDITDRKRAENELINEKNKLQSIIDAMPSGLTIRDLDYNLLYQSKLTLDSFGDRTGEKCYRAFENLDEICENCPVELSYKDGKSHSFVKNVKLPLGEDICFENISNPIRNSNGEIVACLEISTDITERKRAEKMLLNSEERFRGIAEQLVEVIYQTDNNGTITYLSPSAREVFGWAPEEMKGRNFTEFLPENEIQKAMTFFQNAIIMRQPRQNLSLIMKRKDGSVFWGEINGNQILVEGSAAVGTIGLICDVTERKQTEEALRDSEASLRKAQKLARLGSWFWNVETDKVRWSEELYEITGRDSKENPPTYAELASLYTKESWEKLSRDVDKCLIKGIPYDLELEMVRPDGQVIVTQTQGQAVKDKSGQVVKLYGVVQDITERKQAETELLKFKLAFERSGEAIFLTAIDGEILYVNQAFEKLYGYASEEVLGKSPRIIKSGVLDRQVYEQFWNELLAKQTIIGEIINKTKDGRLVTIENSANPVLDAKGNIIAFLAIQRDITETKRLRELESKASRLELAGTIAGQVAHDFNNLLGPIMAYPDLIRDELPHDHKARAFLDDIERAANKIADINQDLMTMGRRGHYNQEVLDLNRIVLHAAKEMESRTSTVICEMDLSEDLMSIKGGAAQIHRMLTNLMVNARDAMENIGQIIIKTENYYADDTSIAFGRVPKGEYVKLTVSDKGCGIPEEIREKILDPFFSTKTADRERGSGLGLSVVDAVIKDHNGYLDLESKIGYGTSFYIYFPVTREGAGEGATEHTDSGGTETILVVDDDDIQREVSSRLLTRLGYRVNCVESGEKAIEFLRENPQDLLLLDMVMPGGIDGTETYRRILEINSRQKAIILSGFSESDRVFEAQKLGAGAFVRKPVKKSVIAAAIRAELDRHVEVIIS